MEENHRPICIVTFTISRAFTVPLSNLTSIVSDFSDRTIVIMGSFEEIPRVQKDNVEYHSFIHKSSNNVLVKFYRYICQQITVSTMLLLSARKCDVVIFFMELGPFMPLILARAMNKRTIWMLPSSFLATASIKKAYPGVLSRLHPINYRLANEIIVYSEHITEEWGLLKYDYKIAYAHEHYIDRAKFRRLTGMDKREKVVGFVGRLSEEKGIMNFIRAVPIVLNVLEDVRFVVIGDGNLRAEATKFIDDYDLKTKVDMCGWIEHDELPCQLNKMTLLVAPSLTEGLPNTMLEAMACGTPVLATAVGAIPDIIRQGQNGYLLKDNTPETIAAGIIGHFAKGRGPEISTNAEEFIAANFTFEATLKIMRETLSR